MMEKEIPFQIIEKKKNTSAQYFALFGIYDSYEQGNTATGSGIIHLVHRQYQSFNIPRYKNKECSFVQMANIKREVQ